MSDEPVSAIRNLGPASVESFARADIHTAQEVRDMGADAAYKRLLEAGSRPHFIGYYVLVLGLQGRPWNDLDADEKAKLRARFDALVAEVRAAGKTPDREMDRMLDAIGIIEPPKPKRKRGEVTPAPKHKT